jgi:sulfur-oxidizing protein SoxX
MKVSLMNAITRIAVVVATTCLTACDMGPKSSAGFTLPDGNAERGRHNYIKFRCNLCHDSEDVPQLKSDDAPDISVALGGETTRIRTYGELVTSIINPSHRVARRSSPELADESGHSRMLNFNDVMTVTEMIDLVAFVQSSYRLSPYKPSVYPVYWIPEPGERGSGGGE